MSIQLLYRKAVEINYSLGSVVSAVPEIIIQVSFSSTNNGQYRNTQRLKITEVIKINPYTVKCELNESEDPKDVILNEIVPFCLKKIGLEVLVGFDLFAFEHFCLLISPFLSKQLYNKVKLCNMELIFNEPLLIRKTKDGTFVTTKANNEYTLYAVCLEDNNSRELPKTLSNTLYRNNVDGIMKLIKKVSFEEDVYQCLNIHS